MPSTFPKFSADSFTFSPKWVYVLSTVKWFSISVLSKEPFFPCIWGYFWRLTIYFRIQPGFWSKNSLLGCPNIFIFIYLDFLLSKILCYDAPELLHKKWKQVYFLWFLIYFYVVTTNFGAFKQKNLLHKKLRYIKMKMFGCSKREFLLQKPGRILKYMVRRQK